MWQESTEINTRSQNSREEEGDRDRGIIIQQFEGKWTLVKEMSYQSLLDEQAEEDGISHLP